MLNRFPASQTTSNHQMSHVLRLRQEEARITQNEKLGGKGHAHSLEKMGSGMRDYGCCSVRSYTGRSQQTSDYQEAPMKDSEPSASTWKHKNRGENTVHMHLQNIYTSYECTHTGIHTDMHAHAHPNDRPDTDVREINMTMSANTAASHHIPVIMNYRQQIHFFFWALC